MITITRAEYSDARIISGLGRVTFTETFGDLFAKEDLETYLLQTFNIRKLEKSLRKPGNIFAIAYFNEIEIGYYKIKLHSGTDGSHDETRSQLQKIYVLNNYQGINAGKTLIQHALTLPELKSFEAIWLLVLDTNKKAIDFYLKHGFVGTAKHFFQIGARLLRYDLMEKKLRPRYSHTQ